MRLIIRAKGIPKRITIFFKIHFFYKSKNKLPNKLGSLFLYYLVLVTLSFFSVGTILFTLV